MKLVIPPTIQVGAHIIKLVRNEQLLEELDLRGQLDGKVPQIRLAIKGRSPSLTFETLVHEIWHFGNYTFGLDAKETDSEHNTRGASAIMAQALLSLGVEPDFSQIPEEE